MTPAGSTTWNDAPPAPNPETAAGATFGSRVGDPIAAVAVCVTRPVFAGTTTVSWYSPAAGGTVAKTFDPHLGAGRSGWVGSAPDDRLAVSGYVERRRSAPRLEGVRIAREVVEGNRIRRDLERRTDVDHR